MLKATLKHRVGFMKKFIIGEKYSRNDIYEILSVPQEKREGNWNTGYHKFNEEWFVFANVGIPGRTDHDYENFWINERLHWKGKTNSQLKSKSIKDLINEDSIVHLFSRTKPRDKFIYHGEATALAVKNTIPVTVFWGLKKSESNFEKSKPETKKEKLDKPKKEQSENPKKNFNSFILKLLLWIKKLGNKRV